MLGKLAALPTKPRPQVCLERAAVRHVSSVGKGACWSPLLIIIGSVSSITHKKGVLLEANVSIRATNWLFGAASDFMVSYSHWDSGRHTELLRRIFFVFTGFRLLSLLSHRRQLWFGCLTAELRTLGIVLNQSPAPPQVLWRSPAHACFTESEHPWMPESWSISSQTLHYLSLKPTCNGCC